MRKGFTLIELLVVIAIIAILASILFPVFAKAREKARQTNCTSNVRQLATAVQMYLQDNNSRYPGVDGGTGWNDKLRTYVGSEKLFFCPSDAASDDKGNVISYGLNGLLVRATGEGCNEAQVKSPTEVGAICDAAPSRLFEDDGGLVGGGALYPIDQRDMEVNAEPRHNGVVVGYCDGHAKFSPGKTVELKDLSNAVGRAFYQATSLGLLTNYGGGIMDVDVTPGAETVTVGGDSSLEPVIMAAAEVWAAKGGKWYSRGFKGVNSPDKRSAVSTGQYIWADCSGNDPGGTSTAIARDAFVFIVSKNCKITAIADLNDSEGLTTAQIANLFAYNGGLGYSANFLQVYKYKNSSNGNTDYNGNQEYMETVLSLGENNWGREGITVYTDVEMMEKVAADPYGIGFCSASAADTQRVQILNIDVAGETERYPNDNPKYRWLVPDTASELTAGGWPFVRTLYVQYYGDDATELVSIFRDPEFGPNAPVFESSFWSMLP